MSIKNLKNSIRAAIGRSSLLLPTTARKQGLYCNLPKSRQTGGPERFLQNLSDSQSIKGVIPIYNWTLNNCSAALVFSASWGDSFTNLCRRHSIRTVLRVDGFYVPEDENDNRYQPDPEIRAWVNHRLERDLERFDHVIYQSDFSKKVCDEYLFDRHNDFSVIYNGVNTSHFIPSSSYTSKDSLRIVVLGKHYPKHLKLALCVFEKILQKQDATLILIGPMRDGSERVLEFLRANVKNEKVLKHTVCKNTITFENLPFILNQCDIFLHVKTGDWCPNAVLEAMSCGLPVVCPAWGGTRELVGDAGIHIDGPPWGIDDGLINGMTSAIRSIQSDLDSYRHKARKRAMNNFDINTVTLKYLNLLGL